MGPWRRVLLVILAVAWGWSAYLPPDTAAQGRRPKREATIEVVVGGEVKKTWAEEALVAALDQEVKKEARVAKVISLARLLEKSGVSRDGIASVKVFGAGWTGDFIEFKEDRLAKLDSLFLSLENAGWNVQGPVAAARRERRPLKAVTKIEVILKP